MLFSFFKENQPQASRVSPEERDIACDACEAAVQVVSPPSYGQVLSHKLQVGGQVQVQVPVLVTKCKCYCTITWSVGQLQVQAVVSEQKCCTCASGLQAQKPVDVKKEGCRTNAC